MNIRLLKYFLTIAEEENITRAAKKLNMTQPPLSRQLKQFEDELGIILFERGKRKMQLTEAGYFLKSRGKDILELIEKTEEQLQERCNGKSGTISIGSIETAGASILPLLIAKFNREFPQIGFNVWNGNTDDIIERLDKEILDIGIVREPSDTKRYEIVWLQEEPWAVFMHKDYPLAQNSDSTIELSAVVNERLIIPSRSIYGPEINHWFDIIGAKPNIFCVYNALMSAIVLVRQKAGIALCPITAKNILSDDTLVYKKVVHPAVSSRSAIIWKKYKYLSCAANNFLISVKKQFSTFK